MEVHLLPFKATPTSVKSAFSAIGRVETNWSWFTTLVQSVIGSGEELMIAALLDQHGVCRSALPLIKVGSKFLAATSCYTTQFFPPLQEERYAFLLGKGLADKCQELRLDCLPEESPSLSAFLAGLRSAGFAVCTYRHFANWQEEISNFADYWKHRSGRLKSLIQRKGKRLESEKRLTYELVDLRAELDRGVNLYESIYAKSWKEPEKHRLFIRTLMDNLGAAGLLRLGIARIDGNPAAVQIWLVQPPYATIFKLAHDPAFEKESPGSLLTYWMMRQIHEVEHAKQFDFGRGDDDYKKLWMKTRRFRCGIIAVNPRSLSGAWRYLSVVLPTKLAAQGFVKTMRERPKSALKPLKGHD